MDLDIIRVINSIPKKHEELPATQLITPWGEELAANGDVVPLAEHPRPQFARDKVWVLNGWWEYAIVSCPEASELWREGAVAPEEMEGKIRVPFSPEAWLSGVGRQLQPNELLWYRLDLEVPEHEKNDRIILHFDGVDHACSVYLGGVGVGIHEGAYQPFQFDVTDLLDEGKTQLDVCVYDPSETGTQLRGKQRLDRGDMWYTAQSGIWQTVWFEVVPETHIERISMEVDPERGILEVTGWLAGDATLFVDVFDDADLPVVSGEATPGEGMSVVTTELEVDYPRLWTPDDPYLYRLTISYGDDVVQSYCAFRTVSVEKDEHGDTRIFLNYEPVFLRGLLDQGYWPDGLMTPPSDEAMVADIKAAQEMGFNMLRKHVKIESDRWYWHCDRLGMLVWQDMPSGGDLPGKWPARNIPTLFRSSWSDVRDDHYSYRTLGSTDENYRRAWTECMVDTIRRLSDHPCILTWILFNESWGQFDAGHATQKAWELDPTRPVLSASGWYDQGTGDIRGVHNYFRGIHMFDDPLAGKSLAGDQSVLANIEGTRVLRSLWRGYRAQVYSEMGGLSWRVGGHSMYPVEYGYDEFETEGEWQTAISELLDNVDQLEGEGLSGFVYTQLTDIEEETNGLYTYDRRVCKLHGTKEQTSDGEGAADVQEPDVEEAVAEAQEPDAEEQVSSE